MISAFLEALLNGVMQYFQCKGWKQQQQKDMLYKESMQAWLLFAVLSRLLS